MNGINILKTLLILTVINLYARDVFLSFQFRVENYRLSYSHFECSYAMTGSSKKAKYMFSFPCESDNILICCKKHKNLIINNLLKRNIIIYSGDDLINNLLNTSSKLTFLPHRFDIIIKNGVVYFYSKGE